MLAKTKAAVESGDFKYTRFLAIGLFRLLELTNARDPKALEGLVTVRPPQLVLPIAITIVFVFSNIV